MIFNVESKGTIAIPCREQFIVEACRGVIVVFYCIFLNRCICKCRLLRARSWQQGIVYGRGKIQDPTRYCLLEGRSVQLIPKCDHSAPVSRRNRQFLGAKNHRHDHYYNNDDDDDEHNGAERVMMIGWRRNQIGFDQNENSRPWFQYAAQLYCKIFRRRSHSICVHLSCVFLISRLQSSDCMAG